jgi:hypothetical protein
VIFGIDNGLDGGICAISSFDGSVISAIPMPCYKRKGKREVDTVAAYRWMTDLFGHKTEILVAIEEPLKHARSSQAVRSMAISFGKLFGMCEVHHIPVAAVEVNDWQKPLLGLVPKGQTKTYALRKANELWPDENWLASKKCTVPHDGMVDAALIGWYAFSCNLKP